MLHRFLDSLVASLHLTTYDWERGYALLLSLADSLSVRYNKVSMLTASKFADEKGLVAIIGHIRDCDAQTIPSYVAILLDMIATYAQLVD